MSLTQNIKSAFETWVDGPPKSRPAKVQGNGQAQNGEKKIYYRESELQQIILNEIEKRLNPLVKRIEYLQTQLRDMQNGIKKPSYRYNKDNGLDIDIDINCIDIEDGIDIAKLQSEMNGKAVHSPQQSLNSDELGKQKNLEGVSSSKKQSTFTLKDAETHCNRLDEVIVNPIYLGQWRSWCRLIKNIFKDRATRVKKVWTIQQQKIIVTFVLFGHSLIGLSKKQMVALAGVSESSFKRWRRTFEGKEKE